MVGKMLALCAFKAGTKGYSLLFVRSIPFSSGQMNRRLVFANDCTFQSYCAVMDPFHNIKGPRISIDTQWGYQLLSANPTLSNWFMYTTFSTISS